MATTLATAAGSSGFAAAVVVVIVWACKSSGIAVPPDVAAAIGTILSSITHYLVTMDRPFFRKPGEPQK